jgi:hypothetical protein
MTIRPRHCKRIDRRVAAESDTIKIHKPNEAGERHLCPAQSEKARIRPRFGLSHPVPSGGRLQHIVAEMPGQEIMAGYQLVNSLIELPVGVGYLGARSLQIWPHLPALLAFSLLRSAAPAIRTAGRGHATHHAGLKFSAVRMKEHDA